MNILLIEKKDMTAPGKVRISGRRLQHIRDILKAKPGDTLKAGELNGLLGTAVIENLSKTAAELTLKLNTPPPPPLPLTLVLAMHRPIVLKRILSTAASLGVKTICLLHSRRVEKSFWNSSLFKDNLVEQHLRLGLEQAGDTVLPEVHVKKRFKPFVEDELPFLSEGTQKILAHPGSSRPCRGTAGKPVTLAIGPEGGFVDYEVEKFEAIGFQRVHLGQRILRVETAVTAVISKLFL